MPGVQNATKFDWCHFFPALLPNLKTIPRIVFLRVMSHLLIRQRVPERLRMAAAENVKLHTTPDLWVEGGGAIFEINIREKLVSIYNYR